MQPDRWQQIRQIFEQAIDLPSAARAAFLDAQCGADAALRQEVDSLIAADQGDATAPDDALRRLTPSGEHDFSGTTLGVWRLLRELGRGGMGAVWLAERADGAYAQQAAVKLMRAGWRDAATTQRFIAERQILASLDHPNIARLIDGGIADGLPYLVLDYVDGKPIHHWCAKHALDLDARIRLLLTVCDAVAHAHARLVVHRDLKPSNILVDRDGRVKLLDFGIAKLLAADAAEHSAVRLFTPDYAAPEQVRGDAITTSVDVHALGLLAYELLTGQRPYGRLASTPAAYEQAILTQEPEPPSRATGVDPAAEFAPLQRQLRGDLDAIVLMALRKRPEDRYASVEAFAADLRRFLAREPVAARRGRWRYRSLRFVQRHALAVALSAVAIASLLAGLGVALHQARQARIERDLAQREAVKSEQTLAFLTSVFEIADPSANLGERVTASDLLARGGERIQSQLQDQPDVRAALLDALGRAQLGLGQAKAAQPLLEQALTDARRTGDAVLIAQSLLTLGAAKTKLGDEQADETMAHEAMNLALPDDRHGNALRGRIRIRLAARAMDRSDYTAAEPLFRDGLALLERATGLSDPEAAIPYSSLLHATGRAAEAERVLRKALAQVLRETPPIHPGRAALLAQLATNHMRRGQPEQAEPLLREALTIKQAIYGNDHPSVDVTRHNLARCLTDLGRWHDAEIIYTDVLRAQRARFDGPHPSIAASEAGLARVLLDSDRFGEAEPLWRSAQSAAIRAFGAADAAVGITALGLGRTLLAEGRLDDATSALAQAERIYVGLGEHGTTSLARVRLEQTRVDLARTDATPDCTNARAALATFANTDFNRGYALAVLAECESRDAPDASATHLAEALELLRTHRSEAFPERRYAEALNRRSP